MRTRLNLPRSQLAAIAVVHTFGDYIGFHPHLHILAANGLIDGTNRFHLMPDESIAPLVEIFRNRFIALLVEKKLLTGKKADELLAWKNSGFCLDAGDKPVASHDVDGRRRLAEYMLRAPFSLEKVHWNEKSQKVIYRSKRSWHTKQNFQVFTPPDFIAATIEHIPPKGQQTIRYYGRYSNKRRGWDAKNRIASPVMVTLSEKTEQTQADPEASQPETLVTVPAPEPKSHRALRPLWRDLILKTWGEDPLRCPCCKGLMQNAGTLFRREEIEFFLRLYGLWEGIISLPPPPRPPFNIETLEPLDVPPNWGWSDEIGPPSAEWWQACDPEWQAPELPLDDGNTLIVDAIELLPPEELPVFFVD